MLTLTVSQPVSSDPGTLHPLVNLAVRWHLHPGKFHPSSRGKTWQQPSKLGDPAIAK
jgi:hypothetical protein